MTSSLVVLVVFFMLLPVITGSARAQETRGATNDDFRTLAARVRTDMSLAGQWFDLLPHIAKKCGMKVEQERMTALANRYPDPALLDEEADFYATRRGPLQVAWDAFAKRDHDAACRAADALWGDSGDQFSGVLSENTE